jgi:hypothetical protein
MDESGQVEKRKRFALPKFPPSLVMFILVLLLIIGGFLSLILYKPEWLGLQRRTTEEVQNEDEIKALVEEISKFMLLPDETPILATVSDLTQVQNQEFFKNAQNEDKVLIFQNAKKAILYRPSEKKIIEVGFVSQDSEGQVSGIEPDSNRIFPQPETTDPNDLPQESPIFPNQESEENSNPSQTSTESATNQ